MNEANSIPVDQHNTEILENQKYWDRKPLLRAIYQGFHREIASFVRPDIDGIIAELGSGIGNIKEVIPQCLRTDIFPNPWLDQIENAYALSFQDQTLSNIILMDVFHHLQYPRTALREIRRVLKPRGRLIIFDPYISALGALVYGILHHEPVALFSPITLDAPSNWIPGANEEYYAAQGNATRLFGGLWQTPTPSIMEGWNLVAIKKFSAISYVGSGGYRGPQLYPDVALPLMKTIDRLCDYLPSIFATRFLVVLEKAE